MKNKKYPELDTLYELIEDKYAPFVSANYTFSTRQDEIKLSDDGIKFKFTVENDYTLNQQKMTGVINSPNNETIGAMIFQRDAILSGELKTGYLNLSLTGDDKKIKIIKEKDVEIVFEEIFKKVIDVSIARLTNPNQFDKTSYQEHKVDADTHAAILKSKQNIKI